MVKQEMAELSTNISGISELKWKEWVNLIQITVISTAVGKNPLKERVALRVNKSPKCDTWMQLQT